MEDKEFIVNIGPQGTFRKSGHYQTLPADIDAMFRKFEATGARKLALYFHGGLVSEKSGLTTAREIAPVIKAAGAEPICIVWETGLIETLRNNLLKIGQSTLFDKIRNTLIKRLIKQFDSGTVGIRGTTEPLSDAAIYAELSNNQPFEAYGMKRLRTAGKPSIEEAIDDEAELKAELEKAFRKDVESDGSFKQAVELQKNKQSRTLQARSFVSSAGLIKSLVNIAIRVIRRFTQKRDHDFYPTLIEEILREFYIAETGAWIWDSMKVKSLEMWNTNSGPITENAFAGTYLLDKIADYVNAHPDTTVDIIGHSAGSCATCHLIQRSAELHPELKFRHIVFMAPACRADLFDAEILSKPERFASLRIFTMSDENEKKDILVPGLYTHSLLYLISGILEDGGDGFDEYVLGMEKYYQDTTPYKNDPLLNRIKSFIYKNLPDRLVLSDTLPGAPVGYRTTSLKHGDFDSNKETLESIAFIIAQ